MKSFYLCQEVSSYTHKLQVKKFNRFAHTVTPLLSIHDTGYYSKQFLHVMPKLIKWLKCKCQKLASVLEICCG
jgi:hypothetical protein